MTWDDEAINQLRALWLEGHSTVEIGRRMGISKNACVGKAHRLDLPPRPSPVQRGDYVPVRKPPIRIVGPTLPPLTSEGCGPRPGEWATETRREILQNLWPTQTSSARIIELMAREEGVELPSVHTIGAYANVVLKLRRPTEFRPGPRAATVRPDVPVTQPRAVVTGGHGQQRQGQILAAMAHRAVTPFVPVVAIAKYGRVIECCWPIGEPGAKGFHSCDAPSAPGRPYCDEHVKIAYVKIRDRREDAARPELQDAAD